MSDLFDDQELARIEQQIDEWLAHLQAHNPAILAVDRSVLGDIRWYVRMQGEEKEFTTVWLTLGQRTLRYETYVMPAPEENAEALYESLLRRNENLLALIFRSVPKMQCSYAAKCQLDRSMRWNLIEQLAPSIRPWSSISKGSCRLDLPGFLIADSITDRTHWVASEPLTVGEVG